MSAQNEGVARVQFPEKTSFLLTENWRFKVLKGGRDAIKSWSVARASLIRGVQRPTEFLCCRELMTSVEESIYKLIALQIEKMGLAYFYEVKATHIFGRKHTAAWGTQFAFAGLRHNVDEIKSYEGFDIALVEEAKNVSRTSWDTLENTIRKAGSEIWVVYNPELESDETHQKFVVKPTTEMKVVHLTWRDNPWPSTVLANGRDTMQRDRPDDYENIWEGQPRSSLADAIYADELRIAQRDNRITRVPYDPSYPVHTYWDLGYGNHTSLWLMQKVALEWHAIGFIQDSNKLLGHYVTELQKLPYVWGTDYLPHDGRNNQLVGLSIESQLKALGRVVEVVPRDDVNAGINAARSVFPMVWFDREACAEGLQCLRHYRWKKNAEGVVTAKEPLHDEYSDGADAWRTFAMSRHKAAPKKQQTRYARSGLAVTPSSSGAWMGG